MSLAEPVIEQPASSGKPGPNGVRSPWLDAIRLLAAFGVIVIHCSPTTPEAAHVVSFFLNFAVPLFLLASLYFFVSELRKPVADSGSPLIRRLPRLLVPYLFWSALYVAVRTAKGLATGSSIPVRSAGDIPGVLFLGEGAVHLYFIPLLLTAMILATTLGPLLRVFLARPLVAGSLAVAVIASIHFTQGHEFWKIFGGYSVLIQLALIHVVLANGLVAATDKWPIRGWPTVGGICLLSAFALDLLWVAGVLPYDWLFQGAVLSVLLLTGAIALGGLSLPALIKPLLPLSYGVYLAHHLFLEAAELVMKRALGVPMYGPVSIIAMASFVFGCSAVLTILMRGRRRLAPLVGA